MVYRHGMDAENIPSQPIPAALGVGTFPVYVGTAPVNIPGTAETNTAVIIGSLAEAKAKLGYSDTWDSFTLCEAMSAHFDNPTGNIGPVGFINVLDPAVHKKAGTTSITFANKIAYVNNENIIKTSCAIATEVLGTDFTVEYVVKDGVNQLKVTDLNATPLTTVTMTFDEVDASLVDADDIIGARTLDTRTGLELVDMFYQETGYVVTALAAPEWSATKTVYDALAAKAVKINGHWDADVFADLDATTATTKALAETWKTTNLYNGKHCICWPMVMYGTKKYHLSTLALAAHQLLDNKNDGVPFESASNKVIPFTKAILANGTKVTLDEIDANDLNSVGITTVNFAAGRWALWGPHGGNYAYANVANISPEDMFLATIRMQHYLANSFQKKYMINVDGPLNRRQIESIKDSAQTDLNGLVSSGMLLAAKILFEETNNPVGDLVAGDFVFDVAYTSVPVAKHGLFRIQYDASGISTLF